MLAILIVVLVLWWFVVVRAWTRNDLRILTSDHKRYCSLPAAHQGPCVADEQEG